MWWLFALNTRREHISEIQKSWDNTVLPILSSVLVRIVSNVLRHHMFHSFLFGQLNQTDVFAGSVSHMPSVKCNCVITIEIVQRWRWCRCRQRWKNINKSSLNVRNTFFVVFLVVVDWLTATRRYLFHKSERESARSFSVNVSLYMTDRERKIKESISRLANKANLQQNIRW